MSFGYERVDVGDNPIDVVGGTHDALLHIDNDEGGVRTVCQ
jgi:hypothetical protein